MKENNNATDKQAEDIKEIIRKRHAQAIELDLSIHRRSRERNIQDYEK